MAWEEVRKGSGKGGSGVEASLVAMQNSIAQLAASIGQTSPGEGPGQRHQRRREGDQVPRPRSPQPQTLLKEGHARHGRDQMCGLSSVQLGYPHGLPVLWTGPV